MGGKAQDAQMVFLTVMWKGESMGIDGIKGTSTLQQSEKPGPQPTLHSSSGGTGTVK